MIRVNSLSEYTHKVIIDKDEREDLLLPDVTIPEIPTPIFTASLTSHSSLFFRSSFSRN